MPRLSSSQNHSGHSEEHIDNSAGADVENDNVIKTKRLVTQKSMRIAISRNPKIMLFVGRNVREKNQNG